MGNFMGHRTDLQTSWKGMDSIAITLSVAGQHCHSLPVVGYYPVDSSVITVWLDLQT